MTARVTQPVRYAVKVIRVRAGGLAPDDRVVLSGVLTWSEYPYRRATLDPARASVGLFYEGPELEPFPPDELAYSCRLYDPLEDSTPIPD